MDELDIEAVGLGDGEEGGGAWVALEKKGLVCIGIEQCNCCNRVFLSFKQSLHANDSQVGEKVRTG